MSNILYAKVVLFGLTLNNGTIKAVEKYKIYVQYYPNTQIIKVRGSDYFDPTIEGWVKDGTWVWYDSNGEINEIKEYSYGIESKNQR